MIDRKTLFHALVVCCALFFAGVLVLAFGADTHKQPPRSAIEQLAKWSTSLAKTNDRFTDAVIETQQAGALTIEQAKTILLRDVAIAQSGQQIANQLAAAQKCAIEAVGKSATQLDFYSRNSKIDAAGRKCLEISRFALPKETAAIRTSIGDVKQALLAVKDPAKRTQLFGRVEKIDELEERITAGLKKQGVTP